MPPISRIPSETSAMVVCYAYLVPLSVPSQTSQTSSPSLSPLPAASGNSRPSRKKYDYCGCQSFTTDCQVSSVPPGPPPTTDSPLSGIEPSPTSSIPVTTDDDSYVSYSDDDRSIAIRKEKRNARMPDRYSDIAVGVGMCMEGIEQNPVVYELMSEMAFRSEKVQVQEWLKSYSRRRYGKEVQQVEAAWDILYRTIYNCRDGIADHNKDYIVEFPDWDPSQTSFTCTSKMDHSRALFTQRRFFFRETNSDFPQPHLWYSNKDVLYALRLFLEAGNDLAESLTYRYDLVDLTRQVLSKLANQVYLDAITAFKRKDAETLSLQSQKFIDLIKDIDTLLASDNNFLLGTWLESAKKLATTPAELKQYEWNAKTQVTMWFDNTKINQSRLHDYANKFWSGLLEAYYLPRASTYFKYLLKSLKENENFKLVEWRKEWISFSNKWQSGTELYPVEAQGDVVAIANTLFKKYLS
ncbi:hypothetical protein GIB67_018231 [Kingdonia uniflora]|uniref:Alpha-N-acetylglucosaminidase n=1 Tax=Kingdonia uniflora TaxID=39325 RepID=A0A7J7NMD3_9MAGN|nr:hypothetical protein GIB67_018231 [Kingdonia uniflora]